MRRVFLVTGLLLTVPFLAASTVAEDPHNQDCEGVVVVALLCAGADGGGNGGCDSEENDRPDVNCWYTFGWNLNASSAGLPGGAQLAWSYEVRACIDGTDCTVLETGAGDRACTWTVNAAEPCAETGYGEGDADFVLALGECVVVTASVSVSSEAWSVSAEAPLFEAYAEDDGEGGGAACYLDNGRD